jgi:hypothetical protein
VQEESDTAEDTGREGEDVTPDGAPFKLKFDDDGNPEPVVIDASTFSGFKAPDDKDEL